MKPFDLEKALAGDVILFCCDERMSKARIICTDRKLSVYYNLVVLVESIAGHEDVYAFNSEGQPVTGRGQLFMASVKRQEWANIHYYLDKSLPYGQGYHLSTSTFESEAAALDYVEQIGAPNYVKSVLIREWEE